MTGLGQDTGGNDQARSAEARRILQIIELADINVIEHHCGPKAGKFMLDIRHGVGQPNFSVSGRQLFWLREIKDTLIDKGVI